MCPTQQTLLYDLLPKVKERLEREAERDHDEGLVDSVYVDEREVRKEALRISKVMMIEVGDDEPFLSSSAWGDK